MKSQTWTAQLITASIILAAVTAQQTSRSEGFTHCRWNGSDTACRVKTVSDGFEIYYPDGGATMRIIYADGNKVWIINDGVQEPGIMNGRSVKRLTDSAEFSF